MLNLNERFFKSFQKSLSQAWAAVFVPEICIANIYGRRRQEANR